MSTPLEQAVINLQTEITQLKLKNQTLEGVVTQMQNTPPKPKEPKVGNPDKFDGNKEKYSTFMAQCNLVFHASPSTYTLASGQANSPMMIVFLGSYLTGTALNWYTGLINSNSNLLQSWSQFCNEFKAMFDDSDREANASFKLSQLTQGILSVSEYASLFHLYSNDANWGVSNLIRQFQSGLRPDIQDVMVGMPNVDTLTAVITQAIQVKNRLAERRAPCNTTGQPSGAPGGPTPMQLDALKLERGKKLPPEEIQRRCDQGLCVYCGGNDHWTKECPKKKGKKPVSNKLNDDSKYTRFINSRVICTLPKQNISVLSLVDSGADESFIDANFCANNGIPVGPCEPVQVLATDNHVISSSDLSATINGDIEGYNFEHKLHVVNTPRNPVVLGRDWLEEHNPQINWSTGAIKLKKSKFPPITSSKPFRDNYGTNNSFGIADPKARNSYTPHSSLPKKIEVCTVHTEYCTHKRMYSILIDFQNGAVNTPCFCHKEIGLNTSSRPSNDIVIEHGAHSNPAVMPLQYTEFSEIASKAKADTLPAHRPYDCVIDLETGAIPVFGPLYKLNPTELGTLKKWINEQLAKGFIRASKSPMASLVLFTTKKDGTLRMCVDYRKVNKMTVCNSYPLPISSALIERVRGANWFTKLDLHNGYNLVRICEGDEWKTAFHTQYGLFETLVMNFGLTNAPPAFQAFMNDVFRDILDVYVVVYLDDILIFTTGDIELHRAQVREVMRCLADNKLYIKLEKCVFEQSKVEFLGYFVSAGGVHMDQHKVSAVTDWPTPKTRKQLHFFLGFSNFYREFIPNYSSITSCLHLLTIKERLFVWTEETDRAFNSLKSAFSGASVLVHADPELQFIVEADASDYAVGLVLSQVIDGKLRPIAFHSAKLSKEQLNWNVYNKELFAIIAAFTKWRHYLEGARQQIVVFSDHRNLLYWQDARILNRRQARWMQICQSINFAIKHRPGSLAGKPDALSRRIDYATDTKTTDTVLPTTLFLNSADTNYLLQHILEAVEAESPKIRTELKLTKDADGVFQQDQRIYVPATARTAVLQARHDTPLAGHMGFHKTLELVSRDLWWPCMSADVQNFVRTCDTCARAKSDHHKPYGLLVPLPVPTRPWASIGVDFITDLPKSKGFDSVLTVVDRLTKMCHFIPCTKDTDAPALATLFIANVVRLHGFPTDITSDRGPQFVAKLWQNVLESLKITSNLSTAFHPQTNGQTERSNQILEQYLRCFVGHLQDDWAELLPLAEFVHNNNCKDATGYSPFYLNYGFHPRMDDASPTNCPSANAHTKIITEAVATTKSNLQEAQERYKSHADAARTSGPEFKVGDLVWLHRSNIRTARPSGKLDFRKLEPFPISDMVGRNAARLKLTPDMKIHNVFHVSLLEPYSANTTPDRTIPAPPPTIINGEAELEVKAILDSKLICGTLLYLIHWKGQSINERTWEPLENLTNCEEACSEFHSKHPNKPSSSANPLSSKTQAELRKICGELNIKVRGNKDELVKRILAHEQALDNP